MNERTGMMPLTVYWYEGVSVLKGLQYEVERKRWIQPDHEIHKTDAEKIKQKYEWIKSLNRTTAKGSRSS